MKYPGRILSFLILSAAVAAGVFPQEKKKEGGTALSQEIQNIINDTYSLDAEYAIDVLLKVARSGKLPDKKWQKRLLEESFRRLDGVQEPIRRQLILEGIPVDNRQVVLSDAHERKLDALSFRTEILRQMLRIDPKEARRMAFGTSFLPGAPTLSCEDALSGDFGDFYEIIGEIAKTGFSPVEKTDQTRLVALLPFIESVTTLAQIAPVGKMIISVDAEKAELNTLLLAYGSAIRGMRASDREFSGFLWSYDWVREFMSVLKVCERNGIQCSNLKDSLGSFVRKNFQSERCADNTAVYREYAPDMVKYLNAGLFAGAPLKKDDLKPASVGVAARLDQYGESAGARRIGERYRLLRWKDRAGGAAEYGTEEKLAPEWLENFEKLLEEVETWNGEDEKDRSGFFHQKCIYYDLLYDLAPASGNLQAKILRALGNFIINDPIRKESRIEWFYRAENYMKMAEKNTDLRYELLENSKSPVIRLYAALMALPVPTKARAGRPRDSRRVAGATLPGRVLVSSIIPPKALRNG